MMRSNRGAARISAVWLITAVVLFLVAVAFAFIAQSDLAKARDEREAAVASQAAAEQRFSTQKALKNDVSGVLGWVDAQSADPVSNLDAAKAGLESLRQTFPDVGETDRSFAAVVDKVQAAYNQRGRTITELREQIKTLDSDVASQRSVTNDVTRDKDDRLATLSQQLADEQQNASQRETELQDRLGTAQGQLSDRDSELRQTRSESQLTRRQLQQEIARLQTRVTELSRATRFTKEPFNEFPDGEVIQVSDQLDLAWINLGANQRLTRGTRFRVDSATPGNTRTKAFAEVIRVEANRAEVLITGQRDRFDPVVRGDVIINPLYDPKGGRNAVLVGRFSGAYNEADLRLLLANMGIHVQPELDLTTHFLIVGAELWSDPDTNEPLEEPIQPSELPVYKQAESQGVQIIPLQEIREFFRVENRTTTPAAAQTQGL